MEIASADKKTQENIHKKILAETLERGVSHINKDYSLSETLKFINRFPVPVSVYTEENEKEMEIPLSDQEASSNDNLLIIITDKIKEIKQITTKRCAIIPSVYSAIITLSKETIQDFPIIENVQISTSLTKPKFDSIVKKTIGNTPDNWIFNKSF